jgi:hypothetical protein
MDIDDKDSASKLFTDKYLDLFVKDGECYCLKCNLCGQIIKTFNGMISEEVAGEFVRIHYYKRCVFIISRIAFYKDCKWENLE